LSATDPDASTLSWLAFSEHERRRALEVIDLFRERGTLDELGIGAVRDGFADLLFPGTSTIQTRARYFLFVPWMYRDLEARRRGAGVAQRARKAEIQLIEALRGSEDSAGTIGAYAGATLQRLPSSVYWQGLSIWGIRRFPGPQATYHRWLEAPAGKSPAQLDDEGQPLGATGGGWHPGLPEPPPDFPNEASFRLTSEESAYLVDRLAISAPNTMLALLAQEADPEDTCDWLWEHPLLEAMPASVRESARHAQRFSLVIHGAALLYNHLLARKAGRTEAAEEYADDLQQWSDELVAEQGALAVWDRHDFWHFAYSGNPRITPAARRFIDSWLDLALSGRAGSVADDPDAQRLVEQRERRLKGGQSRFHNDRALEMWSGSSGADRLRFRWPVVQTLVTDLRAAAV